MVGAQSSRLSITVPEILNGTVCGSASASVTANTAAFPLRCRRRFDDEKIAPPQAALSLDRVSLAKLSNETARMQDRLRQVNGARDSAAPIDHKSLLAVYSPAPGPQRRRRRSARRLPNIKSSCTESH